MEWFRSYHGAPTDPKWRVIAKRAGVRCGDVAAIFWALMDHASQQHARGDVTRFDAETVSCALDYDIADVERVIEAFKEKLVIENGRIANWEKYQSKREDKSTERVKRFRETQRNTLQHGNAPREEKSRGDITDTNVSVTHAIEVSKPSPRRQNVSSEAKNLDAEFEIWFAGYPHKVGKAAARLKYLIARRKGVSVETLLIGRDRYISTKPPDREWCNPATWLNQERWLDEPDLRATNGQRNSVAPGDFPVIRIPEQSGPKSPPPKVSPERLRELGIDPESHG